MRYTLVIAVLIAVAAPAAAQSPEAEVRAVIDGMFDGMRDADAEAVRSAMHGSVRLMTSVEQDGEPGVRMSDMDGFIAAVGNHEGVWDEQIYDVEILVDDGMATVWAPFTFYRDGELSHCGVNSFQLARTADGWKIVHIIDSRRGEGCPDPGPAMDR